MSSDNGERLAYACDLQKFQKLIETKKFELFFSEEVIELTEDLPFVRTT